MKRILLILLAALCVLSLIACDTDTADTGNGNGALNTANCYTQSHPKSDTATLFVQFNMKGGATFVVELFPEYAPQTVANFQKLVGEGFYNGLTFHRIVEDFMIQGGDPKGDGTGTIDQSIPGEFASNGYTQNTLSHVRGVLSMARRTAPDSASCQFFIMNADYTGLDGNYAAFGRVVAGMETIDAITALPVKQQSYSTEKSKPINPPVIESAVFVNFEKSEDTPPPTLMQTQESTSQSATLDIEKCYTEELAPADGVTRFVQFKMQGGATFVAELYPEYAPQTVANFQSLVSEGFYNGLTFHRIVENFMIQGGDPQGDGTGTLEQTIPGEFSSNGFEQNTLKHERGVLSMARRTDPDSASCQFFIMHQTTASLDGKYAAFGRIVAGMETVDAIAKLPVTAQKYSTEMSKPVVAPVIESVTFVDFVPEQ